MGLAKILGFQKEPEMPPFLTDGSLVDPEEFDCPKVEVKVNGKKTPLSVGNSFLCPGADKPFLVTIGGIMVAADATVSYLCEWIDPNDGTTKTDMLSIDQMKRFIRRNTI